MKKVFLDTNVLLDFITGREGVEEASSILLLGEEGQVSLTTSFLTMANVAYVARKGRNQAELYELMRGLSEMVEVLRMDEKQFQEALSIISTDFEDVLQFVCANTFECDAIVTRNKKDFKFSAIKVLSPEEFLSSF